MCGIAGFFQINNTAEPDLDLIGKMTNIIKHRGPDEFGLFFDNKAVLGHARLSIIDLSTGSQPLANEDESIWITYNGEVYNYLELRATLEKAGHSFKTTSDTEVIIHAYEEYGYDCLTHFNGQFSFCIYDKNEKKLFIARDRLGIRPLFYTTHNNRFYFASEIKSILCDRSIPRNFNLEALDQILSWWVTSPPTSCFENIHELESGCWLEVSENGLKTGRYWQMTYPETFDKNRSLDSYTEELHDLLVDSVRLRLRADVPVGAYLSGGLDSSVTTALIKNYTSSSLETFSISFEDPAFDESAYQKQMAEHLGTNHHIIKCSYDDIANNFPQVIYHTEKPILRTAPTPLMLLAGLVRKNNFKVVLTGEGADEILGGYDIFKEALIRNFWAKNPDSKMRPSLLRKLYPTLPLAQADTGAFLENFYKSGFDKIDKYYFSHIPRINTASKIKMFYSADVKDALSGYDCLDIFANELPSNFDQWHHLSKAQYVEARSLMAGYILSSQGDRVASANSVEGRFPFLDHRLVEFAATIPPLYKIMGLNEKFILKRAMKKYLPDNIAKRVKQPYMAPDSNSFVQKNAPAYVGELLSEESLKKTGLFNPAAVKRLYNKCQKFSDKHLSFKDNMSFVSILSTQLLHHNFIDNFDIPATLEKSDYKHWTDFTKK